MRSRRLAILGILCALTATAARPVAAQYFGQNKIRYHDFPFAVLSTQHFDVYYYAEEKEAARRAALLAERWYETYARRLRHQMKQRQPLVLYASHADFVQTNIVDGSIGEATGGVTEGQRQRMALPLGPGLAETNHVLAHELVHAFQYDLAKEGHGSILAMPLWFIEGMAEFLSRGPGDPQTAMWMRDAVRTKTVPSIDELANPKYFPYRYGHAFWEFLTRRFGDDVVRKMLLAGQENPKARLAAVTGQKPEELSKAWVHWVEEAYADASDEPPQLPSPIIDRKKAGHMNVGPSLSPDGRHVAFVSEKDLFSIEIFLADATTGWVQRKLIDRTTDPHFDSLEFIESAGTWAPDSRRFAFGAVRNGKPVLVVLDTVTGRTEKEIALPSLGQAWNPAWSPDGRSIAFTGARGGQSDLYLYDLPTAALRQLTDDPYADLQPAWSPDGRSLAFTTDRFSTDLRGLHPGAYELAIIDPTTREIRPIPAADSGEGLTPQWSKDGASLYFVRGIGGIPNVFRADLTTGQLTQVTRYASGVSGITSVSPAISVAGSRLAFSTYTRGGYNIGVLNLWSIRGVTPVALIPDGSGPRVTEPVPGEADLQPTLPAQPATQTKDAEAEVPSFFKERPYKRHLTLDHIGQPYLSAGGGSLGAFFRAGMVMSFADMLGDQSLFLAIQGGRRVDDFAGRAVYINRRSRWNWGVSADFLPAVFTRTESQYVPASNAVQHVTEYQRQTYSGLSGLAFYPFNKAQRLEFSAGVRRISFGNEIQSQTVSVATGQTLDDTSQALAAPRALHLAETSAALVYDSAVLGPTSPLVGRRYRFEIAPSFGSLNFTTLLADFRQYLMPVRPFTLAFRVRYIARVGHDADDPRLIPLVLSLRDQARGYDLENVATGTCGQQAGVQCSALDVLSGSRLMTANAEVRFPLLGVFSRTLRYGAVPLEGFAFADLAALRTRSPASTTEWQEHILRSVGAGVRVNAAGVVFEFAAARPLDWPGSGWRFAFNIVPGF